MWSGESEAQKSGYTSDNNATWLQTSAFLIALKIWQQNVSSFRRYGNYPREVAAPTIACWGTVHVLAAQYINLSHTLANNSDSVSESHSYQH